jgi:hypothetical protein
LVIQQQQMSTWQAIALILAPVAAAVAAAASWASVREARKASRPLLNVQIVNRVDTRTRGLFIVNAGGGMARSVLFVIADDAHFVGDYAQHGFLPPGGMAEVVTDIPPTGNGAVAFALCRGADGFSQVWTHDERHYTAKQRRTWGTRFRALPMYRDLEDTYDQVFPDAADPATLDRGTVLAVKVRD